MPTKIEWTEETWNPVTGCTPVSEGCENCYARRIMANRLRGRFGYPLDKPFGVTVHHKRLNWAGRWRKPRRVFVCSMGDLFHARVPPGFVVCVLDVIRENPRHTFLLLTKRPRVMCSWLEEFQKMSGRLSNLWAGTSAENQRRADERIPWLLKTPAAVRFVSLEPLLGPVDLRPAFNGTYDAKCGTEKRRLDWVIVGGETGPGARPMRPAWVRSIRDQCKSANVPFFFKSWGEWAPTGPLSAKQAYVSHDGRWWPMSQAAEIESMDRGCVMYRVGRKRAGRLLDDGVEHSEYPQPPSERNRC